MKPIRNPINPSLLSILTILLFTSSLRAQQQQPAPPPDTVFPLGGLYGIQNGVGAGLLKFGLNMEYSGTLSGNPGQGAIIDEGGAGIGTDSLSLNLFLPGGTYARGYNPYYLETDVDLVSNESGPAAWDLNNVWYTPLWTTSGTYNQGQLVTDAGGNLWVCIATNTGKQLSDNTYWFQTSGSPLTWDIPTRYSPGEEAYFYEDDGDGYADNRLNPLGNASPPNNTNLSSLSPAWPNTAWVSAVPLSFGNDGQTPGFGNQQPSGDWWWTQIATKAGSPIPPNSNVSEWNIPFSTGDIGKAYLDYTFYANSPLTNGGGDFLGGGKTIYLDFISRLDPGKSNQNFAYLPGNPDDDAVYEIDATAHFIEQSSTDGGKTWTDIADAYVPAQGNSMITYGDYGDQTTGYGYRYDAGYANAHFGNDYNTELHNIINFPNPTLQSTYTSPNPYSVYRLAFILPQTDNPRLTSPNSTPWDSLYQDPPTTGTIYKTTITSIHFALKCGQYGNGIFVRGVRLRTGGADWLLRGKLDNHNSSYLWPPGNTNGTTWPGINSGPNCIFRSIKNDFTNPKTKNYPASAWPQILGITANGETDWPSFRVYAYLNELWRKWSKDNGGQKDIFEYITPAGSDNAVGGGNLSYWRSIYEDQSGGAPPPPAMQNESPLDVMGSNAASHTFINGANMLPGDIIPSIVKNHLDHSGNPDFNELARDITGWNGSSYGATTVGGASDHDDYASYTANFQTRADSWGGTANALAAISSYPQDRFPMPGQPSQWVPYYSYPGVMEGNEGSFRQLFLSTSERGLFYARYIHSYSLRRIYEKVIMFSRNFLLCFRFGGSTAQCG